LWEVAPTIAPLAGSAGLTRTTFRLARCFLSAKSSHILGSCGSSQKCIGCIASASESGASCHNATPLASTAGSPDLPRCSLQQQPSRPATVVNSRVLSDERPAYSAITEMRKGWCKPQPCSHLKGDSGVAEPSGRKDQTHFFAKCRS
jgi:hypothetical protein